MRTFWAQPLRRQLFIANLLLLGPVLAVTIWLSASTFREQRQELADQAGIVATTTAAYVNRDLVNYDRMVANLLADPAFAPLDTTRAADLFARVLVGRPAILRIALIDRENHTVVQNDVSNELLSPGTLPAAAEASGMGRSIVPMQVSDSGNVRYVVVRYPLPESTAGPSASLALFLNLQSLQQAFLALPLPDQSIVAIADHAGQILARSAESEGYVGRYLYGSGPRTSITPLAAGARAGADGITRIFNEALVDAGPWIVSVGIPLSAATGQVVSLWTRTIILLATALAGWLAVALIVSRRLNASVRHLNTTAKRIAAGDFSPMTQKPMLSRELDDLQTAFGRMLQGLNETKRELDAQMAEERQIRQALESLQGQVIRQERLAAVGQLVSGVAHEINNPLQAILGFAELLQMQPEVPDSVKSDLRLIQKESARACGIIRNLALFARQQPGEAAPLRLLDVITSVTELRQRRLESEDIELRIEDASSLRVMAVMTELQQVVLNFVVNAEQAIVSSGRLPGRITVRTLDRDGRSVLEVEDTGPGISPENEAKLFQPFFTTKPVGQGTGLGLSVSYGIIDSLGGHIGYRRAEAGGAIFYFELPAATDIDDE